MGWKKDFVDDSVPFLPISGWIGDNLIKASDNMKWWKPVSIKSLSGKKEEVRFIESRLVDGSFMLLLWLWLSYVSSQFVLCPLRHARHIARLRALNHAGLVYLAQHITRS